MLELGSSGSVRGVLSNEHPYRQPRSTPDGYVRRVCANRAVIARSPKRTQVGI